MQVYECRIQPQNTHYSNGIYLIPSIKSFLTGFVYFFKGNMQYKYDPKLKYVISTRPANDLLDCKVELSNEIQNQGQG